MSTSRISVLMPEAASVMGLLMMVPMLSAPKEVISRQQQRYWAMS
jgi:hypothetical protein